MKRNVILAVILLTQLTVVLGVVLAQSTTKHRVANDSTGLYFKNRFGVYILIPRDCGFIGCIGPDLRLVRYRRIPHADPATFQILINPQGLASNTGVILARDKNYVFYGGQFIATGDVGTLQVVGEHAKDKNNVYFHGLAIQGMDSNTVQFLGLDFISDRNGLFLGTSSPPRRAALVDYPTFKMLPGSANVNGRYYVAEDKNFDYYTSGGSYEADSKPNTIDFRKLGCSYYYFAGRIFHSLYKISGADPESFRVLGTQDAPEMNPELDINSCSNFYALDKVHRYEFGNQVRPDDTYRNHQIDLLLATPEDRKKMSEVKQDYVCIPQLRPGVNFGYSRAKGESTAPGTIKFLHYVDAGILEGHIIDANGQWQSLPTKTEEGLLSGCDSVGVQRFDGEKKPWFSRRDSSSISLVVGGQDPLFVVADRNYSIKLVFSKTALTQVFRDQLKDSSVTTFENNTPGWGSGWILENKFFMGREQMPEVWLPLRVKDAPIRHVEGWDYVTVGFRFSDGQFECIDPIPCSNRGIPQKLKADFTSQ